MMGNFKWRREVGKELDCPPMLCIILFQGIYMVTLTIVLALDIGELLSLI